MRRIVRGALDLLTGNLISLVTGRSLWRSRLRVLAYHGISDTVGFRNQMELVARHFTPVDASTVVAAVRGGYLPPRSVWVTFDDGDPTVVEQGLPILGEFGIPATMFVCPGVIDTHDPYWWQVLERASAEGMTLEERPVAEWIIDLKHRPDLERRTIVELVRRELVVALGIAYSRRQLSSAQLEEWLNSGHSIGNHTWDHAMLDKCDETSERLQISDAHQWLTRVLGSSPTLFAYPNGNVGPTSARVLRELGYDVAVLFDHATSRLFDPLLVSRLRVNADGNTRRFSAVVSGFHPYLQRWRNR